MRPVVRGGRVGEAILEAAKVYEADSIAVGSREHGAVASLLLGSVTDYLLHNSTAPLLIVAALGVRGGLSPRETKRE